MVIPSICSPYDPCYSRTTPIPVFTPLIEREPEQKQSQQAVTTPIHAASFRTEDTLETLRSSLLERMQETYSFLEYNLAFIQNQMLQGRWPSALSTILATEQRFICAQQALSGIHNRIITYSTGLTTFSDEFKEILLTSEKTKKHFEVLRKVIVSKKLILQLLRPSS